MLESYFVRPKTVDRIRESWLSPEIERHVCWLAEHGYTARSVTRQVPLLVGFGEFAWRRGARAATDLPEHIEPFVVACQRRSRRQQLLPAKEVRGPVEQMLALVMPGFVGSGRPCRPEPFAVLLPGFFEYLVTERGLRPPTIRAYRHHLSRFEAFLARVGVARLDELAPALLSAFVAERAGAGLAKTTLRDTCGVLRVFLRYAFRQGLVPSDLSLGVEGPLAYRLASIPRSISWEQVGQLLACVDRRSPVGRRDYAILLLLVTYGLRGREVAALRLDDIDWRRERLAVPERKAGHSTAFPLSGAVGEALVDYLRHARPETDERRVFFRVVAPVAPIGAAAVSALARSRLIQAGIEVPRPGSHTLRHTCVQRLVEADFALKTIGDFVGHRSPRSTEIYAKVAVESLREVALGDGEAVLA